MAYTAKSYDHLKGGALKGLSDAQLDQHFTLYKGYVAKLNEISRRYAALGDAVTVPVAQWIGQRILT